MAMRAFIAVPIPEAIRAKIAGIQQTLAATGAKINFVEPRNLHFCLKFLGEIPDNAVPKLKELIEKVAGQNSAFDLRIAGAGAFPSTKYVRVFWLGVAEGKEQLIGLAVALEAECQAAGFRPEERPFTPHLTVGRVKFVHEKEKLRAAIEGLAGADIGMMRVDAIKLFKSTLTPAGPVYEELHSARLGPS